MTYSPDAPDPAEIAAARALITDPERAALLPAASRMAAWQLIRAAHCAPDNKPSAPTAQALTVRRAAA